MSTGTTPLGFLPSEIELHSHCMFLYGEKDDVFVRCIAEYLWAGINANEMCVCIMRDPVGARVREHMASLGVKPSPESASGQFLALDDSLTYMYGENLNLDAAIRFWEEKLEVATREWRGLRTFVDVDFSQWGRATRLKVLEHESLINVDFPLNIALCGYQSDAMPRSLLLQAKSVHPYIANCRSIRRNPGFLPTDKFLAGFYRFVRVPKVYPADLAYAQIVREDFDEIAARTPLTLGEIRGFGEAVGVAFVRLVERCSPESVGGSAHVHVSFAAQHDRFVAVLRRHCAKPERLDVLDTEALRAELMQYPLDDLSFRRRNGDCAFVLTKRFPPWPKRRRDAVSTRDL